MVVDTNVARAVDALRTPGAAKTYDARERWVREQAAKLDLRVFEPEPARVLSEASAGGALRLLLKVEPRRGRGRVCDETRGVRDVRDDNLPVCDVQRPQRSGDQLKRVGWRTNGRSRNRRVGEAARGRSEV